MISDFQGKTAVLTGAGSGFGLECARIGAAPRGTMSGAEATPVIVWVLSVMRAAATAQSR